MKNKTCYVCNAPLNFYLETKDYFHSKETFQLLQCPECQMIHTDPIPPPELMPSYYASENYISHNSEKLNLITVIYKIIRNISFNNKFKLISKYKASPSIIDYGCGTGNFLKYCKDKGCHVSGVEPNADARETASKLLDQTVFSDMTSITGIHNIITLWHVLEHLDDPVETITSLRKYMANDGYLIIAVPNYDSFDAQHYGSLWAGYDVPRHLYHLNQRAMHSFIHQLGMNIVQIHPMKFDAYYVSLLSEQYAGSGAFSYLRAIFNGFKSNRKAVASMNYSSLIYVIQQ